MSLSQHVVVFDGVWYPGNIGVMLRTNFMHDPDITNIVVEPENTREFINGARFSNALVYPKNYQYSLLFLAWKWIVSWFVDLEELKPEPLESFPSYSRSFFRRMFWTSTLKRRDLLKDVDVRFSNDVEGIIQQLKSSGYTIVALDNNSAYLLTTIKEMPDLSGKKIALVVGSERDGVRSAFLDACDYQMFIPTKMPYSLNVSIAHGIAVHHLFGQ